MQVENFLFQTIRSVNAPESVYQRLLMPEVDNLPVFTHPYEQITFYTDDPNSHKQILTILNPYEFQVKFKVLVATVGNVRRYAVNIASGIIRPHHAADIVLKHLLISAHNVGIVDRVRVSMSSYGATFRCVGRKDIQVTLAEGRGRGEHAPSDAELFEQLEGDPASLPHLRQHPLIQERQNNSNKFIYIAVLLLGSIILAMPKEGDFSEYFPNFLPRPTSEMKFMITFLLGVISCLLLQS